MYSHPMQGKQSVQHEHFVKKALKHTKLVYCLLSVEKKKCHVHIHLLFYTFNTALFAKQMKTIHSNELFLFTPKKIYKYSILKTAKRTYELCRKPGCELVLLTRYNRAPFAYLSRLSFFLFADHILYHSLSRALSRKVSRRLSPCSCA